MASQIGIESSGRIAILNNPGTGYENLVAAGITATSFAGNGAAITAINPANISGGTAGISITGNADTVDGIHAS